MGFEHLAGGPPAPLRNITRLSEEPSHPVATATGHPRDEGQNCDLIGRHVNGATELSMGVYRMDPNQLHPLHYHSSGAELYYIMEGSCAVTVDDEEVAAEAGMAIYLPEGTKHAVRTGPDESVTILWVFDEGDSERITTTWLE